MPPKKSQDFNRRKQLKKWRETSQMKRLQETSEQRNRRLRIQRHAWERFSARAQSRDLLSRQVQMCQEVYDIIRNHKTRDNLLLCRPFIRAPNRMSLPEYYDIVKSPIDLLKIQQKLKAKGYLNMQQFSSDIELLVTNAKSYYKESTQEYQDACELWQLFSDTKIRKEEEMSQRIIDEANTSRKITVIRKRNPPITTKRIGEKLSTEEVQGKFADSDENESEPEDEFFKVQWLLYKTVKNFINLKGQKLSELFWKLPSRSFYPDYYKEVKNPISLLTIKTKIKQRQYSSLSKVVADMKLMFKYNKMYNRKDSVFFEGAVMLEKVMQAKAKELSKLHIKGAVMPEMVVQSKAKELRKQHKKVVNLPRWRLRETEMTQKQKEIHNHLLSNTSQSSTGFTQKSTADKNEKFPYKCLWDNCCYEFTDHWNLVNHLVKNPYGHIRQTFKNCKPEELKCLWYNCERTWKNFMRPFPSVYRLIRHVKEVHLRTISNNTHQKKKDKLVAIRHSQSDPTTLDVDDDEPPIEALVTQPTSDSEFRSKCKKCSFSDMKIFDEITDGCNTETVLKCSLCFTTKVFGMEYPPIENKLPKSQTPIINRSQVPSIKQELILPDDGTNSSFNESSEPTRVNMMFYMDQDTEPTLDQSTSKLKIVAYDTYTAMDTNESLTNTTLPWPSSQLPSSTTMDSTCDIPLTDTLPVDLNLIKKEINDETIC